MLSLRLSLTICLPLAAFSTAAAQSRYLAALTDDSRVEGNELRDWAYPGQTPKIDGTDLFSPKRQLRWLLDLNPTPPPPEAEAAGFVELTNGDRLPGRLLEFVEAQPDAKPSVPAHLLVAIEMPAALPAEVQAVPRVRVLPRFVRRVVWGKGSSDPPAPGTLLYRDGHRLSYQGLRWQRDAVRVLVDGGVHPVPLIDLAEVRLPRTDAWQDYCDELALLDPELASRWVRLETTRGWIATAAEAGARPGGVGGPWTNWYQVVCPAWSLDPLWLPLATVRARHYFPPQELPPCRWPPVRYVARPLLGHGWTWQLDRNVEGGPLASAGQVHGWGLGVHAPCELWFEVPAAADGFRSRVGLDRLAGSGGCARGVICLNRPEAAPLYRSKQLIGSQEVVDTGVLRLTGPAAGQKFLILVADPADADRPTGADPLDIRDALDWIEPVFLLDRGKLKAEVAKRGKRS